MKMLSTTWFIILLTLCLFGGTGYVTYLMYQPPPKKETEANVDINGKHAAALWNVQTGFIEQIAFELRRREDDLDERALQLQETEDRVHNEMLELQRYQTRLVAMQKKLDDTILVIENEEVKNLRAMAVNYGNMDAEQVIEIFDVMDDIEVVKILYFMEPDIQSDIFSAMIDRKAEDASAGVDSSGPMRVVKLNEMLKFAIPPQKQENTGLF